MPLELYLTYRGPVYSSGNRSRDPAARARVQKNKHDLRLRFHDQLLQFCELPGVLVDGDTIYPYILELGRTKTIGNYEFFALGGKGRHGPLMADCICRLDILLLRPVALAVGDLDGKLKTVFDALCFPNKAQLASVDRGKMPRLMHCLVEDDDQITGVGARYDYLFDAKNEDELLVVVHALVQPQGRSLT